MATTVQMVEADIYENATDVATEMARQSVPSWLVPLFKAGWWLGKKLTDAGASNEEADKVCEAMGQRCAMADGARNAYHVAAGCYDAWLAGRRAQPGTALAKGLIEEAKGGS